MGLFQAGAPPNGVFAEVARWELHDLGDLRHLRVALREVVAPGQDHPGGLRESLPARLLLVANELASNALRHGGGAASVVLSRSDAAWLLDVADPTPARAPSPAADRTPAEGGYGLYLVQALGAAVGWYDEGPTKHVWSTVTD